MLGHYTVGRTRIWLSALAIAAALACNKGGGSGGPPPPPPPDCTATGGSCFAAGDCCSGACSSNVCVLPQGQCHDLGGTCTSAADCCTGTCEGQKCVIPATCGGLGDPCAANETCCSGRCDGDTGRCVSSDYCKPVDAACNPALPTECCTGTCNADTANPTTGTCGVDACKQIGTACTDASNCCSGVCSGSSIASGTCQAVPTGTSGFTCGTLGEACTSGTGCCSTNCQGGVCVQAYSCQAYGDLCYRSEDCCSGVCDLPSVAGTNGKFTAGNTTVTVASTAGLAAGWQIRALGQGVTAWTPIASVVNGTTLALSVGYQGTTATSVSWEAVDARAPGRCIDEPGGCVQGGDPCSSGSNCCSRVCKDMGTGVKVCAPGGGCRMTGEYCDTTASCCGGSGGYGIFCDAAGQGQTWNPDDTSTQDDYRCTNGTSCNPPGNICGDIASQNCCDGKKAVCKADLNGVMRCFGGGSTQCPTGYDGGTPGCCIPEGGICQFRDQCCGYSPCVPDSSGVLRCAAVDTCKPNGTTCSGASDTSCCSGLACTNTGSGWKCADPTPPGSCVADGGSCAGGQACCSGVPCIEGSCATCGPNGMACTADAQCCSGTCDGGVCRTPCVSTVGGSCTVGADCCSGLGCVIPPGATGGSCQPSTTTPSCGATYASCSASTPCCDSADTCTNGTCQPPVNTCAPAAHSCTADGDCCSGLLCYGTTTDPQGNLHLSTCVDGIGCACEVPVCLDANQPCSPNNECCGGYCARTSDGAACDGTSPCACVISG